MVDKSGALRGHPCQIDDAVPEKDIATQTGLNEGDDHLNSHRRAQQRLMDGGADAEEKHRAVEVAPLVRGVNPPQETEQHHHHPGHAKEGNSIDGDRLAPHDAAEAEQRAGDNSRNHADGVFPFAGHVPQFFNSLHEHAAAARNHEGNQTAGQGGGGGFAHFHPPGDVAHGQQLCPEPRNRSTRRDSPADGECPRRTRRCTVPRNPPGFARAPA